MEEEDRAPSPPPGCWVRPMWRKATDFMPWPSPPSAPERSGAPIRAFTKLSGSPVGDRSQVVKADYSIYLDDTLFTDAAFDELKENGKIILNTRRTIEDERVITLDGTAIAQEILRMPITNTIMLGAFAAVSGIVSAGAVEQAIRENMPEKLQVRNIAAVSAAIREVAG